MKLLKVFILSLVTLTLTACVGARYSTKKNNYIKMSKTLHPIVVPAGAMAPEQKPYYLVPKGSVHVVARKAPSMKPPGLQ